MNNELTNLLPPERQRALRREYFYRIIAVIAAFVTTLIATAAILLIPTYIVLNENINAKKGHLMNIESSISSSEEVALSERLNALSTDAASLAMLSKTKSVGSVVRSILDVPRPGITILSFSYTQSTEQNSDSKIIIISGLSATRAALRNYQLAIQTAPLVTSAIVPVSAYAKDSDISFTITVTIVP